MFVAVFLAGSTTGHHVADVVITARPENRRFGPSHTLHFTKIAEVNAFHCFPSQGHWNH
jgi:hypothetical protein